MTVRSGVAATLGRASCPRTQGWEAADLLADEVRAAVASVPRGGRYKLCDQLVRSADSIAANISEGSARQSVPDRLRFYHIALASAQETLNFLKRARGAKLFDDRTYYHLANRTSVTHSLLSALIRKLGG